MAARQVVVRVSAATPDAEPVLEGVVALAPLSPDVRALFIRQLAEALAADYRATEADRRVGSAA